MRQFVWNRHEFIRCLGVLPETDEDETYYSFKVERDGLRLELTVFEYDGGVYVSLYREGVEPAVFTLELSGSGGARYVNDRRVEFLEFAPAEIFRGLHDGEALAPYGFRVYVSPHIRIETFAR